MGTQLVRVGNSLPAVTEDLPDLVFSAGTPAEIAWRDYFVGSLPNEHTRRNYNRNVRSFLGWCEDRGIRELARITPGDFGEYLSELDAAIPTKKQHRSAVLLFRQGSGDVPLARQLQAAIAATGQSLNSIAKSSAVAAPVLQRFVNDERGITLETAGKIAAYLKSVLLPDTRK